MLIFLLLHFYTWTQKFAFLPGDPFWVQIWPVNCFELLCGPYGIRICPNLGPFGWWSNSCLMLHFWEMAVPPFPKFLPEFLHPFSSLPLFSPSLFSFSLCSSLSSWPALPRSLSPPPSFEPCTSLLKSVNTSLFIIVKL